MKKLLLLASVLSLAACGNPNLANSGPDRHAEEWLRTQGYQNVSTMILNLSDDRSEIYCGTDDWVVIFRASNGEGIVCDTINRESGTPAGTPRIVAK